MRNVLRNTDEVWHYYANQIQDAGKSGNTSFRDSRAYSYAACIARRYGDTVILSSKSYSITTSRHQAALAYACRHLPTIRAQYPDDVQRSHRAALLDIDVSLRRASVARQKRAEYISDAIALADQFNQFAALAGSNLKIDPPVTDALTLATIAATERARKKALAEQKREREARALAEQAEKITAWRSGADNRHQLSYALPVALRVSGDWIETTKGARIPVSHCARIWKYIQQTRTTGIDYTSPEPIGVYKLTRITARGDMAVGCHQIPYAEITGIATQLGLR